MTLNRCLPLLALLACAAVPLAAQTLDPTFAPTYAALNANAVRVALQQPDGKVLVGGSGAFLNGALTSKLRRLNADGSPDAAFLAQTGTGPDTAPNLRVESLALQPDGKILVGGFGLVYYDGLFAPGLVRLNTDGSTDRTFNAVGSGLSPADNLYVTALAVQADGKILVATNTVFRYNAGLTPFGLTYNGQAVANLFRLNPNGSLDTGFVAGTGLTMGTSPSPLPGVASTLLVQSDGKIVVGGRFDGYAGTATDGLLRLNPNGSLDASFRRPAALTEMGTTYSVVQQPDGKLVAAGVFSDSGGANPFNLMRLNPDGTPDGTFGNGKATIRLGGSTTLPGSLIARVTLQADGSLLVAGKFSHYNGVARGGLAKVSGTGALDATFAPNTGISPNATQGGTAYDLQPLAAGQYLASGFFAQYDGTACSGLVRLNATGTRDASYAPLHENGGAMRKVVPLANGQLLVQGSFARFNGVARGNSSICTLNANGVLASTFSTSVPHSALVLASTGQLFAVNSTTTVTITRLLPTGAVDGSFAVVALTFGTNRPELTQLVAAPQGGYLITGAFSQVNGVARPGVARLLANGALDPAFAPAIGPWQQNEYTLGIKLLANGQVLLQWSDSVRSHLARLNANGTLDPTLNLGSGPAPTGYFTAVPQPDGSIVLASDGPPFTSFNGMAAPQGMVRLLPGGAPDPGFVPALALQRPVLQPDGRVLGIQFGRTPNSQLVRLNANGTLDASFPPLRVPESVYSGSGLEDCVFQPDGRIILCGGFVTVGGQVRTGLARLNNTLLATQPALVAVAPAPDVFPNPAQGQATLRWPATAGMPPAQARLLDAQGREVRTWPVAARATEATLSLTGLSPGVYVLQAGPHVRRLTISE